MTIRKKKAKAARSMRALLTSILAGILVCPALAPAAEIRAIKMEKEEGVYHVRAETWLKAAPDFVFAVLLDYDEFHRLTRGITSTRWLDQAHDGYPLAYTRIDSCVVFFCRKLEKVEIVRVTGALKYSTEAIPERGDFLVYTASWDLRFEDGGTRILYEMRMQPDFWVPPLIGPWAIRRKAESSALKIAQRIEFMAANQINLEDFDLENYPGSD